MRLLVKNCYMTLINLKDAYYFIKIPEEHKHIWFYLMCDYMDLIACPLVYAQHHTNLLK